MRNRPTAGAVAGHCAPHEDHTLIRIRIYLFLYGRVRVESEARTARAADQAIDRLITEVLGGRHGTGEFSIDADFVNEFGAAIGHHYSSGTFRHPAPPRVLKPASS
jgi:hypothetical protein